MLILSIGNDQMKKWKNQHPLYRTWIGMKRRCYNPKDADYQYYGAKGVVIEWKSFRDFCRDMGNKPTTDHTIERINSNKNYCKENCTWATRQQQSRNRSVNILVTINGTTRQIAEWAELVGISRQCLRHRIFTLKWPPEIAIAAPFHHRQFQHGYAQYKNHKIKIQKIRLSTHSPLS
jgi:hypothetical protein